MVLRGGREFVFDDTDRGGIVHVANIKGGVGKSTIATNLAFSLSEKGPTLIIDLDAQGSATHALGKEPGGHRFSSRDLFRFRVRIQGTDERAADVARGRGVVGWLVRRLQKELLPSLVGSIDIASMCVRVAPGLDLLPASAELFKRVAVFQQSAFVNNLAVCCFYYKYIVIDSPSAWNRLTRLLYRVSDLNLIPVTLNALSTKSLKDYLREVLKYAAQNPQVRIRIVKNEVYGSSSSKIKGKTRTMHENRRFLENLCEQVVIRNAHGVSVLPQAILFDLEIPESAVVRDAQDRGKPVRLLQQHSLVARAFDELAQRVQFVFNTRAATACRFEKAMVWRRQWRRIRPFAWLVAAVLVFGLNPPVEHQPLPRPIAPQQLSCRPSDVLSLVVDRDHSIYRLAKYAICKFRAVVPSHEQIVQYIEETLDIHNKTRLPGERMVGNAEHIPRGMVLHFYPPSRIINPIESQLLPVYRFFTSLVSDSLAYVTGDWCERGSGGGEPHYGIDIAAEEGAKICAPVSGTVYTTETRGAGNTLGIVSGGYAIFFCHMGRRFFKNGDRVEKGMPVGTVGMSGKTSGPHVHIGYGVRGPGRDGIRFGPYHYKITDPKLFFYRNEYLKTSLVRPQTE